MTKKIAIIIMILILLITPVISLATTSSELTNKKNEIQSSINEAKDISVDNVKNLKYLEPFGESNKTPIFIYRNLKIDSVTEEDVKRPDLTGYEILQ